LSASSQLDFTLLTECSKLYHYTFNFTMVGERKTYCEEHHREHEEMKERVFAMRQWERKGWWLVFCVDEP